MIHRRFNNYGKKDKFSLDQFRLIRQDMLLDMPLKNSFTEKTVNTIIIQYIEHLAKDTFDFDYLVPCFIDEVLPGDTINLNVNSFARLATQVVPLLDNMYLEYFFFFVPKPLS